MCARWPARLTAAALTTTLALATACTPRLADGRFGCDPADSASCPAGFFCQVRGDLAEYRCYASSTEGYCGNGRVDPGEECDGSVSVTRTCHELGYWYGTLRCTDRCRLATDDCVALTAVSSGMYATCAVDTRGQAWCWGNGRDGCLGNGSRISSAEPLPMTVPERLTAIAVGMMHVCGLTDAGEAWCWGMNFLGELGIASTGDAVPAPVPVDTPVRFQSISAGYRITCGVDLEGQAWCWGNNLMGQLGDGTRRDRSEPAPVQFARRFAQVSVGFSTTCALDADGQIWCWGTNGLGQLGDGLDVHESCDGVDCSLSPVAVAGGHVFTRLASSTYASPCGLDADGQAWCWGNNDFGQLGDGTTAARSLPTRVSGVHGFTAIAGGIFRTSALDEDGKAWVWGLGATGDGSTENSLIPLAAAEEDPFTTLATGWGSTCGLTGLGHLRCWGFGGSGQLGAPTAGRVPRQVVTPAPFTGLAIGRGHTCGLDLEQRAHCWGFGLAGEGGGGDLMNRYYPHPVVSDQTFTALALGSSFTAALDPDGRLWLWGMLEVTPGNFLLLPAPQRVGHADPYAAIAAGDTHLCVLDATGLASCWGDDSQGQLGIAGLPSAEAPQPVQGDHRFAGLALGGAHSCATDLGGEIWCWGNNDVGQLGSGTHDRSPAPVRVVSPRPLEGLSVGWSHGCGLDGTGTGWCWGSNHRGQLGSGWVGFYSPEPLPVASPGPLLQIVASYSFTCALDLEGKAWCWGGSDHGEEVLGTGELVDRYAPVAVSTDVRFLELVSKGWHTCGLDLQGDWHCWGENPSGQLGVDDQVHLPRPVAGPVLP